MSASTMPKHPADEVQVNGGLYSHQDGRHTVSLNVGELEAAGFVLNNDIDGAKLMEDVVLLLEETFGQTNVDEMPIIHLQADGIQSPVFTFEFTGSVPEYVDSGKWRETFIPRVTRLLAFVVEEDGPFCAAVHTVDAA